MIQEVKESHVRTKKRTLPLYDRSSKMRSLKITPPETLPELAFKRAGPKFPNNANFSPPAKNQESYDASMLQYNTHLLCRWLSSQGKQQVPGFGGFISTTGKVPPRKSTIDFYTPINQPITDNAVVCEILKRSEAATEEVGQPYTINTFDLGVVMKACPIVWKYEEEFSKHVILVGKFHTVMNYMGKLLELLSWSWLRGDPHRSWPRNQWLPEKHSEWQIICQGSIQSESGHRGTRTVTHQCFPGVGETRHPKWDPHQPHPLLHLRKPWLHSEESLTPQPD